MLNEFIDYLLREVECHSIYVLGAQGQRGSEITEAWIKTREHGDEKNIQRDINLWKKNTAAGFGDVLGAFDCSGLGMYFLQNKKGLYTDKNANGMRGICDEINREDVRRGDWLFKVTDGRASHIGYAIDSERAVEARGRDYGVVITDIDTRSWNAYGRPKVFADEIEAGGDFVSATLKKGSKGSEVASLQYALIKHGYNLPKYGADGSYGSETVTAVKKLQQDANLMVTGEAGEDECDLLGLIWKGEKKDYKPLYLATAQIAEEQRKEIVALKDEISKLKDCISSIRLALETLGE